MMDAATTPQAVDARRNSERPALPPNCYTWNDRHAGDDVYIVGAGRQLAYLTDGQVAALGDRIVIGGNNTFYKVKLTYFMSAYQLELWKALRYVPVQNMIYLRLPRQQAGIDGVNILNRTLYTPGVGLPRFLTPPVPALHTVRNQAFAMLHLAVVMGARRVFTIGIDQRDYAYFWQYDDTLRQRLRQDMHKLQAQRYLDRLGPETRDAHLEAVYSRLDESAAEAEAKPFYEDFTATFAEYIAWAQGFGCQIVTTTQDSVLERAGAPFLPLNDALASSSSGMGHGDLTPPPPTQPQPPAAPAAPRPARKNPLLAIPMLLGAAKGAPRLRPGPILVAAAPGVEHRMAELLGQTGVRMGSNALFAGLCAEAVRGCWTRYGHERIQKEPLWDYPEPLVEYLSADRTDPLRGNLRQAVEAAFASPEVLREFGMDPQDGGLENVAFTWGWSASLDIALLPVLLEIFPALRLIYVHDKQPLRRASALRDDFQMKTRETKGLRCDEGGLILEVDGAPPRQMHVFTSSSPCPAPRERFTMRCETLHGAEELLRVYHHLGTRAVAHLGNRAAIVAVEDIAARPARVMQEILRKFGAGSDADGTA